MGITVFGEKSGDASRSYGSRSCYCVEQYDKKVGKRIAGTYHIVRGEWSYFNIDSDRWIGTYGEGSFSYNKDGQTLQARDTAVMCVKAGHDRNLPLQLNNFEWNLEDC